MLKADDTRAQDLQAYARAFTGDQSLALSPLNGDASFRRYFRGGGIIAVDSPPQTQKNREFIAIDKALFKAGLKAPQILYYDLKWGFLILEDLGDTLFSQVAAGTKQEYWYLKALALLPKLSAVQPEGGLPPFDEAFVRQELEIFRQWFLDKALGLTLNAAEQALIDKAITLLATAIPKLPVCAMHRDFHCRNLMVLPKGELAILDFQDMVRGPYCYDAASLLYDCYVELPSKLIKKLQVKAHALYRELGLAPQDFEEFIRELTLVSLQRHLKVLGIFCRLYLRDGKAGYLGDLPLVLGYVLRECAALPEFAALEDFLLTYAEGHLPCAPCS
ncbi:MAG: phosphotransferase [Succinivibrio sp.]|nr:phosphotransferase [Succinivibrio sp.]